MVDNLLTHVQILAPLSPRGQGVTTPYAKQKLPLFINVDSPIIFFHQNHRLRLIPYLNIQEQFEIQFPSIMAMKLQIVFVFICSFFILTNTEGIQQLRFDQTKGEFKILQVADMHYADGSKTPCEDVLPDQFPHCSDLNTTDFIQRMIDAESPDLIVFTGDNIYGSDATDAEASMNAAFAPAISSNIPWTAVLGNHDQESTLSREGVMNHIVQMKHTLSLLNPPGFDDFIDGFGNYNLQVFGTEGSDFVNSSILNLYFLDSGDYSTVPSIPGYGWIKTSQQLWFQETSMDLQNNTKAPGLAYFHIPLPRIFTV
ncbi:unnamed protein product [Lactuca virosa]|uniref:Calcineurin-like phosphoesterase domain-containing protein n=1 Tax=Lactuca virosa TaxID=75947 RepID=A0AAU9M2K3_9ASTR|nr:unnamed protein product [Lactuca virosa]